MATILELLLKAHEDPEGAEALVDEALQRLRAGEAPGKRGKKRALPLAVWLLSFLPEAPLRDLIRCLVERGEDLSARGGGDLPPLYDLVAQGERELVRLLLERGADPNQPARGFSRGGRRALHEAARRGDLEMAQLLLGHGANPNLFDECGVGPVQVAVDEHKPEMAALLRSHGAVMNEAEQDLRLWESEAATPCSLPERFSRQNLAARAAGERGELQTELRALERLLVDRMAAAPDPLREQKVLVGDLGKLGHALILCDVAGVARYYTERDGQQDGHWMELRLIVVHAGVPGAPAARQHDAVVQFGRHRGRT